MGKELLDMEEHIKVLLGIDLKTVIQSYAVPRREAWECKISRARASSEHGP